jgi:hypothetical protein
MTPSSPISRRTPTPTVLMRHVQFDGSGCGDRHGVSASTSELVAAAATVLPMHRETEIDETTTDPATDAANVQKDLRYRLQRMSLKLSEQERRHTSEIVRLRKENERLLLAATRSRREKDEAHAKAQRYKHIARRMREKAVAMHGAIKDLRNSSNANMGVAAQQTKSLMERLFLSDVRRRDLEARFGSLARPSTNLQQKLASPRQSAMNDLSISEEGPSAKFKYLPGANAPPSLVIAPRHLDDRSFSPKPAEDFKPTRPQQQHTSHKVSPADAKRRQVPARVMIPQFNCKNLEVRMEPLLKPHELELLQQLTNVEDGDEIEK